MKTPPIITKMGLVAVVTVSVASAGLVNVTNVSAYNEPEIIIVDMDDHEIILDDNTVLAPTQPDTTVGDPEGHEVIIDAEDAVEEHEVIIDEGDTPAAPAPADDAGGVVDNSDDHRVIIEAEDAAEEHKPAVDEQTTSVVDQPVVEAASTPVAPAPRVTKLADTGVSQYGIVASAVLAIVAGVAVLRRRLF